MRGYSVNENYYRKLMQYKFDIYNTVDGQGAAAVVKAACLESLRSRVRVPPWRSGFKEPQWRSGFKETKCFFLALTRKDSALWGASVTER